jgi:chromosome segregation ATPase
VYIDNSSVSSLQRKLARAEARVTKLENEQEILLEKCETHIAVSRAHAFREHSALKEVDRLKKQVGGLSTHMEHTEALRSELEDGVSKVRDEVTYWKSKYSKMKQRVQSSDRS